MKPVKVMECPCGRDLVKYRGNDRNQFTKPVGWDCAYGCFIRQVIDRQNALGRFEPCSQT